MDEVLDVPRLNHPYAPRTDRKINLFDRLPQHLMKSTAAQKYVVVELEISNLCILDGSQLALGCWKACVDKKERTWEASWSWLKVDEALDVPKLNHGYARKPHSKNLHEL